MENHCSAECMNNGEGVYVGYRRYGERDARYGAGSERLGVGWRR